MSKSVIVGTRRDAELEGGKLKPVTRQPRPYINKQFSNDRIGIKDEDPQPPILGGI